MKDYYGKDATRLKDKKLFLFDMDGTIYLGDNLFEGVPELLQKIENKGGRYVFITNNASKSVSDYVAKLHRLGLTKVTEEHFFTSAQAMLMLLKEKQAHVTDHALIMWLSCTDHVAYHALITRLIMHL